MVGPVRGLTALALLFGLAALTGCPGSGANGKGSAPPASESSAAITSTGSPPTSSASSKGTELPTVAAVLSTAPDADVVVSGLYLGWEGPCTGSPPTRSAWQLADSETAAAGCVYVDGPLMQSLAQKAMIGKPVRVRVHGTVRQLDAGTRYLESRQVERQ